MNLRTLLIAIVIFAVIMCACFPFAFTGMVTLSTNMTKIQNSSICPFCCSLNEFASSHFDFIKDKCVDDNVTNTSDGSVPDSHSDRVCGYTYEDLRYGGIVFHQKVCSGKCSSGSFCSEVMNVATRDYDCVCSSQEYDPSYASCGWVDDLDGMGGECGGACPSGYVCVNTMSEICTCEKAI